MMEVRVYPLQSVVMDLRAREWCKLPYGELPHEKTEKVKYSHPKGCPNYGKKKGCPPQAPLFTEVVEPPFLLVAVKFDLGAWARRMKDKYPDWSDKQARCCLYWQGKVRKKLREACVRIALDFDHNMILYNPEAMGVHVFATCHAVGLTLERNPQNIVYKIAIIGRKKNEPES